MLPGALDESTANPKFLCRVMFSYKLGWCVYGSENNDVVNEKLSYS